MDCIACFSKFGWTYLHSVTHVCSLKHPLTTKQCKGHNDETGGSAVQHQHVEPFTATQSKVIIPLDPASSLAIVWLTAAHQHSKDGAILMPLNKSVITHNTHHSHFGSICDLGDMLRVSIKEVSLVANDAYHSALLHPLLHKVTHSRGCSLHSQCTLSHERYTLGQNTT